MAYKTWSYSIYAFIPTAWNEDIQVLLGFMLQISKEDDAGQDRWPLNQGPQGLCTRAFCRRLNIVGVCLL